MADVHIYFGSQSGTAESFSEDLQEEAEKHGIKAEVRDLQTFTPEGFAASHIVIMVVATYGDGEPTDNAVAFHKWVSNPKNDGALKGQRFTVMGLGDMNYSRYNNMGQLTDQSLERMGGIRIYKRGVGDDSQDIVSDFETWREGGLWEHVKTAVAEVKKEGRCVSLGESRPTSASAEKPLGTAVLSLVRSTAELAPEPDAEPSEVAARFYFEAERCTVAKVRELRQHRSLEDGLSTMEVELEASGGLEKYTAGGTLALLPRNAPSDVSAVLKLLGLSEGDLAKQVTVKAKEGSGFKVKKPFPTPCTLGDALSLYCDLAKAPTKKLLTALQEKLDEPSKEFVGKLLSDADALKALQSEAVCCRMHEFWALLGVKGGLDPVTFLQNCPRQRAREFTIASSPLMAAKRISLCVSLTTRETESLESMAEKLVAAGALPPTAVAAAREARPRFLGMCSRYISADLKEGDAVLAKYHPSSLTLPSKDVPIVMVGAGAGVAPFRGFWDELRKGPQVAPAVLFFGCRHPNQELVGISWVLSPCAWQA
ncbi:Por [Symbiodinium natans]|uniref:NADPH--hemoprotein reductase n=1 Tax=Symbiodinium natans TaxID=878477 RepID=A0A812IED2_9DINO|nr:Por [Symbiodinium natans]